MAKYRKKPVTVEAFQMTEARRWDNSEWPNWLNEAWQKPGSEPGAFWCDPEPPHTYLHITSLEGVMDVTWDDWIIQGVQGEIYPCKPDIFEQTYESETLKMERAEVHRRLARAMTYVESTLPSFVEQEALITMIAREHNLGPAQMHGLTPIYNDIRDA